MKTRIVRVTMSSFSDIQAKYIEEIRYVDDLAQIVLKGHLVIEEIMTEALQRFVLHGEFIDSAKLQFHQKLTLCRAISTSEHKNNMWNLIAAINTVRNHLSHSLDSEKRSEKVERLNSIYVKEFGDKFPVDLESISRESAICMLAISGALGYLHSFLEEIKRLEEIFLKMDEILNKGNLRQENKR